MNKKLILVFTLIPTPVFAAGYFHRDQSPFSAGMSQASEAVNVNDPSGLWGNPAVAAWQESSAVNLSMRFNLPRSSYKNASSSIVTQQGEVSVAGKTSGSDFVESTFLPSVYGQHRITDLFAFAWGVTSPASRELEYSKSWIGRYDSIETRFFAANIEADLILNLGEVLGISLGVSYQISNVQFTFALPDPALLSSGGEISANGDSLLNFVADGRGVGFQTGLSLKASENLMAGLSFRSQIINRSKGDLSTLVAASYSKNNAELTMKSPSVINLGLSYAFAHDAQLFLNGSYSIWSINDVMDLEAENLDLAREIDWKDTYMISIGGNVKLFEAWQIRTGLSYETGPGNDDYKTTVFVYEEGLNWSFGVGFEYYQIRIDFAYSLLLDTEYEMNFDRVIDTAGELKFDADYSIGGHKLLLGISSAI